MLVQAKIIIGIIKLIRITIKIRKRKAGKTVSSKNYLNTRRDISS